MLDYTLQEGQLQIPEKGWQDNSIQMFRHSDTNASLIITRGVMKEATLESEMQQQWEQLKPNISNLHYEVLTAPVLPKSPNCLTQETCCRFKRGGHTHYQYQLAIQLPGKRQLLLITYTTMHKPTPAQGDLWQRVKASIQLT